MKAATLVVSMMLLLVAPPTMALFDCWEGQSLESLTTQSDLVLVGRVSGFTVTGCKYPDGHEGNCPSAPVEGAPLPDRVVAVTYDVQRTLKGAAPKQLTFTVLVPILILGCNGPAIDSDLESLTFLRRQNGGLRAWGGDYAIYPATRWDYSAVLRAAEKRLGNKH